MNMASTRKKSDEKFQKILRDLASIPSNKHCFDCHQRGPTYVNVTIGSFICTRCSGILRGLTPPHRVKSISMATFSLEEIELLKSRGNEYCKKVWLGLCDNEEPTKDEQQIKEFMISKYEKKRYYMEGSSMETSMTKPLVNGWNNDSAVSSPQTPSKPLSPPQCKNGLTVATSLGQMNGFPNRSERTKVIPFPPAEVTSEASFANFENNPIFTAAPSSSPSTMMFPSDLDFGSGFKDPWEASLFPTISLPNNRWSYGGGPISEDRYAALKDLDFLMKTQLASTPPTDWTIGSSSEAATVPQEPILNGGVGFWSSPQNSSQILFNHHSTPPQPQPQQMNIKRSSNPFACDGNWNDVTFSGNPFKSPRAQTELGLPTNNWVASNGFPTSQSLFFGGPNKPPWSPEVTPNPFASTNQQFVGCENPGKVHHSSNPFL